VNPNIPFETNQTWNKDTAPTKNVPLTTEEIDKIFSDPPFSMSVGRFLRNCEEKGPVNIEIYHPHDNDNMNSLVLLAKTADDRVVGKCGTHITPDRDGNPGKVASFKKLHFRYIPLLMDHDVTLPEQTLNDDCQVNTWEVTPEFRDTGLGTLLFEMYILALRSQKVESIHIDDLRPISEIRLSKYQLESGKTYFVNNIPRIILKDDEKLRQLMSSKRPLPSSSTSLR